MILLRLREKYKTGRKWLRHITKLISEQKSESPQASDLFMNENDLVTCAFKLAT